MQINKPNIVTELKVSRERGALRDGEGVSVSTQIVGGGTTRLLEVYFSVYS